MPISPLIAAIFTAASLPITRPPSVSPGPCNEATSEPSLIMPAMHNIRFLYPASGFRLPAGPGAARPDPASGFRLPASRGPATHVCRATKTFWTTGGRRVEIYFGIFVLFWDFRKAWRRVLPLGPLELFSWESLQGVVARNHHHESHCKESLQGVIVRSYYKESLPGVIVARSHCKESLQGVIARSHYKESLQGVIARSHCKESLQGVIARSHESHCAPSAWSQVQVARTRS